MEASPLGPTVTIHGSEWQIDDIREEVNWLRAKSGWELRRWSDRLGTASSTRAALSQLHHVLRNQLGESSKIGRHDHCRVCWWTLSECDDPAANQGYTYDGRTWVCVECFDRFIGPRSTAL
jgi:hypothetical protein